MPKSWERDESRSTVFEGVIAFQYIARCVAIVDFGIPMFNEGGGL